MRAGEITPVVIVNVQRGATFNGSAHLVFTAGYISGKVWESWRL